MTDDNALSIDPGPTLPVNVVVLYGFDEQASGILVVGTTDEALARRVAEKHIADSDEFNDEQRDYLKVLFPEPSTSAKAGPFRWITSDDVEDGIRREVVNDDDVSEPFDGIRFDMEVD